MDDAQETRGSDTSTSDTSLTTLQENIQGLRRVRDDIPSKVWVVASIGFWEKATFWGLTAPWQNYMQHPRPQNRGDTPGALGLGQVKATRIYCAFYIGYYVTPLIFAVVSDNHLGRYKTLLICLALYNVGCGVLTISSLQSSLEKGWGLPGLLIAMVSIGLGGGGVSAIMSAFLADQYTENGPKVKTLKSGERVVTDRSLTLQYIYSLYYWLGNLGSLSWFATVSLEKNISFTWAYCLTSSFMIIALLILALGGNWYVKVPHESNILPKTMKILLCASRNGFKMARADPKYQLEHRQKVVPWSSRLVSELCRGLRACRVLVAFIVFYICFDQMQNNLISQAGQMETKGTPNDMLPAMNQVGCILFVPLIQKIFYPFLHRRQIYLTSIARIAIGFAFITVAMLYATTVQYAIYQASPCHKSPNKCDLTDQRRSMGVNVWFQAPIYFLISISEIFAYVTALEYAYCHAPKDMKAIVQSISLILAGIGSACAMGLTPIAHDPYLVIFYASIASAMAATTLIFWVVFRKYDEDEYVDEAVTGNEENSLGPRTPDSERNNTVDILKLERSNTHEPTPTAVEEIRREHKLGSAETIVNSVVSNASTLHDTTPNRCKRLRKCISSVSLKAYRKRSRQHLEGTADLPRTKSEGDLLQLPQQRRVSLAPPPTPSHRPSKPRLLMKRSRLSIPDRVIMCIPSCIDEGPIASGRIQGHISSCEDTLEDNTSLPYELGEQDVSQIHDLNFLEDGTRTEDHQISLLSAGSGQAASQQTPVRALVARFEKL